MSLIDYIAELGRALGEKATVEAVGFVPSTQLKDGLAGFAAGFRNYYGFA